MTDKPHDPIPLVYARPAVRPRSILKWFIFGGAIWASLASAEFVGCGGAAAGMWIAFALMHIEDTKMRP